MTQFDNIYSFFGEDFPAIGWFDITPNDNNDLSKTPRSLFIGDVSVGKDLVAVDKQGNESTFSGINAGDILPIQPVRIKATGTTVSGIIGLL